MNCSWTPAFAGEQSLLPVLSTRLADAFQRFCSAILIGLLAEVAEAHDPA
jgi:hypothetical protein